jgi:L-alanine-DL-glutamate epimerase-like enolase superfamily enzyme
MRIERVELFALRLPLKTPFLAAGSSTTERKLGVLRLTDDQGVIGLGEITTYPHPASPTLDELIMAFEQDARPHLEGREISEDGLMIDTVLPPPVDAAIDVALLDLRARRDGVRVADLISADVRDVVEVNATITAETADEVTEQAKAALHAGFGTIKLKVGMADDRWRVSALRDAVGFKTRIRLDANGAWFTGEAIEAIGEFSAFGIELIEQPVAPDDLTGMHRVRDAVFVPVVADEGVRTLADLEMHVANGACDGVAIKLSQVGGIAFAAQLADSAKHAGLLAFVTSTLDGPIGLAAGLHFAAARPEFDLACGLATADLFGENYAIGLPDVREGAISLPDGPGLGIEIDEDALSSLAIS